MTDRNQRNASRNTAMACVNERSRNRRFADFFWNLSQDSIEAIAKLAESRVGKELAPIPIARDPS